MSSKTKKLINTLIFSLALILVLINLPYEKIRNSTKNFIDGFDNFITNIDSFINLTENNSADHHIKNISFYEDNNNYYAVLLLRTLNPSNISSVVINNYTFKNADLIVDDKSLIINISPIITDNNHTVIKITAINTPSKEHISTLETAFYKSINYQIIERKKQSMVGISAKTSMFSFNPSSTWGSGVILSKQEVIKTGFWSKEYTMYEYIIITNYHVVSKGDIFQVYYENENDAYPKSTRISEPDESVVLVGSYTNHTDLAILKLTTFNDSLVPLNDEQLITNEFVPVSVTDQIFLIGSPYLNDSPLFNSYKIGQIKNTSKNIALADTDLCSEGCNSIETTAYLGEGSSGGGLFDVSGNLIGIHFAGNEEHQEAYAIPLWQVADAIKHILGDDYLQRSQATSFFILLHSQFQESFL